MIEINLLPGGVRKKAGGGGPSVNVGAMMAGLSSKFGDKVLIGSMAVIIIAVGAGAWLYYKQTSDRKLAESRLEKALTDSTRFAKVVADRNIAEAKRDTLLRQVNLVRAIDDDRFIWPHIMDEVSRALPQYTWVSMMTYGGAPAGARNVVAAPPPVKASAKDVKAGKKAAVTKLETGIPRDDITIRLTGRTVDIQAMTRFMKDLEESPFFGNVYNERTTPTTESGKEYYQFQLILNYTRPDSNAVRRLPLIATRR
jgi:Tfp pilus assembly protein PilN